MNIFVKTLIGRIVSIDGKHSDAKGNMKDKIQDKEGIHQNSKDLFLLKHN